MKIFIEVDDEFIVTGWATSSFSHACIELDIEEDHPLLQGDSTPYRLERDALVKADDQVLSVKKKAKDEELNEACAEAIFAGFSHTVDGTVYWFSFDIEAQLRFQGVERIFSKEIITDINWTVKEGSKEGPYKRISITKPVMEELQIAILNHTDDNISLYRDVLLPQVYGATTIEEVEAIEWPAEGAESL